MPVPYQVECSECKGEIEVTARNLDFDGDLIIVIEPCEACLEQAREEAKKEGREEGFEEGKEEGKRDAEEAAE